MRWPYVSVFRFQDTTRHDMRIFIFMFTLTTNQLEGEPNTTRLDITTQEGTRSDKKRLKGTVVPTLVVPAAERLQPCRGWRRIHLRGSPG